MEKNMDIIVILQYRQVTRLQRDAALGSFQDFTHRRGPFRMILHVHQHVGTTFHHRRLTDMMDSFAYEFQSMSLHGKNE